MIKLTLKVSKRGRDGDEFEAGDEFELRAVWRGKADRLIAEFYCPWMDMTFAWFLEDAIIGGTVEELTEHLMSEGCTVDSKERDKLKAQ